MMSSPEANIVQHIDRGTLALNLQRSAGSLNPVDPNGQSPVNPGSGTGGNTNSTPASIPYRPYEKRIIAHAVFCSLGFIVFLPIGALVGRWLRLALPTRWFGMHANIQFWLCKHLF
jgi:hypothetical protein